MSMILFFYRKGSTNIIHSPFISFTEALCIDFIFDLQCVKVR